MSSPTMNPPPPRTQPPPPVFSPPVASYRSARKEELDALRQKGLAKIFNKHFTSVADKIRLEREAAELALQEIIKRKAELDTNPKSFKEGGLTLTQLDKLHMELKKRKSEVQRKEKETQELYKRYCSQYGDDEHVFADVANWKNSTTLPVVHEGAGGANGIGVTDIIRQADLAMTKANTINGADVHKLTANIEENVEENAAAALKDNLGSDNAWTPAPTGLTSPNPKLNSPYPDAFAPSAKVTPTKLNSNLNNSALDTTAASTPSPIESPSLQGNASVMDRSLYFANFHDDDDDDDSCVSGLTDIDGATVAEAEWKLTEFLRTETDNIKKMLRNDTIEEDDQDEDDDNYSIFTYNRSLVSGESDRVGRAAREAEELVARMAEATAWMNDPTLLENDSDSDEDEDSDEEVNLEWVAFWSECHKREYYHNSVTNQTCWTKPMDVDIDYSNTKTEKKSSNHSVTSSNANTSINMSLISPAKSSISRIDSPVSDEKVAVRDFTKISKGPSPEAMSLSKATSNHMINSFRSEDGKSSINTRSPTSANSVNSGETARSTTKTSKVMQYRRRRARIAKRNRRVGFALMFALVFGIILFHKRDQWMTSKEIELEPDKSIDTANALKKLELAKKLTAADAERRRVLAQKKLQEEAEKSALISKRAMEEKERIEEEAESKRQEAMQVELVQEKEAMQLQLMQEEMHRPWACNIPLSYLMSRKCWKVAKANPVYDCNAITDVMMQ